MTLKLYTADFKPIWPVGCVLLIAAYTQEEAEHIAKETVKHTDVVTVKEVTPTRPGVIVYNSGEY